MLHWHRKRVQTCQHNEIQNTRRTFDRQEHTVSPKSVFLLDFEGEMYLNSFVDFAVLQLYKPGRNGGNVALLGAESDATGALGVLQLRVRINASIAH